MFFRHVPPLLLAPHSGGMESGDVLAPARRDERGVPAHVEVGGFPRSAVGPETRARDVLDSEQHCDEDPAYSEDRDRGSHRRGHHSPFPRFVRVPRSMQRSAPGADGYLFLGKSYIWSPLDSFLQQCTMNAERILFHSSNASYSGCMTQICSSP